MLLAYVTPEGNKKQANVTQFLAIPKNLPQHLRVPNDVLVASTLASLCGNGDGSCKPSYAKLKELCGICGTKTMCNIISRLRKAGLITTATRGDSRSLRYRLLWNVAWEKCLAKARTQDNSGSAPDAARP